MKPKIFLSLLLFCSCLALHAQDQYLVEAKSVSSVFMAEGLTKAQIQQRIGRWMGDEERAEVYTIVTNDPNAGNMTATERSEVYYKNIGKQMYPKRSGMAELLTGTFNYLIAIGVEDGSYMVKYTLTSMEKEMYGKDEEFFDCVNFEELDPEALEAYNKAMIKLLKMNVVLKGKRQIFLDNSAAQFEEVSNNIMSAIMANMGYMHQAVINPEFSQ